MSYLEYTVEQLGMDHSKCSFSTGIDESLTAGQGSLDEHGFWSIPCPHCRDRMTIKLEEADGGIILKNWDKNNG